MAIFYRPPPQFVGGNQPLAPHTPAPALGTTTPSSSGDTSGPLEWQRTVSYDAACHTEWRKNLQADCIAVSDTLFSDVTDVGVAPDWLTTILEDYTGYTERRTTRQADQISPADFSVASARDFLVWPEWLHLLRSDVFFLLEYTASTNWIMSIPSDWRSVTQADVQSPVETKTSIYADSILLDAWNFSIVCDRLAFADMLSSTEVIVSPSPEFGGATGVVGSSDMPLEWRSEAVFDTLSLTDWRSGLLRDMPSHMTWNNMRQSDAVSPLESGAFAQVDRLSFVDLLSSTSVNVSPPPEFGGATGVIGNSAIPLEWRMTFQSDRPSSFDVTQSVLKTGALNTDFLATALRVETVQSSWESTGQVSWTTPIDWVHVTQADAAAPLVWSVTATTSHLLPVDWTAPPPQIAQDAIFAVDWTSPTHQALQDSEVSIEWNTHQDADASFSLKWTKPRLTKGSAATQVLSPSPISPASPVAPTTKGGAAANYVTVKSV